MRHFIRMMEMLRLQPDGGGGSGRSLQGAFWTETFEKAQIIVLNGFSNRMVVDTLDVKQELDLPFECCAFEAISDEGIVLAAEDYKDSEDIVGKLRSIEIRSLVVRETAPREYSAIGMLRTTSANGTQFDHIRSWDRLGSEQKAVFAFLRRFLEEMAHGEVGYEKVREKVKIGRGNEKRHMTIRQVVRVMSRKEKESAKPAFSREIEWSHRFRVRGHWRKIVGLGKDREGRYSVSNFTWVSDFVKGPEDKPLIEKVRVVAT
jgi:hypothetical protein